MCFYDIGSDGMVTLWARAAQSVYNMFSVSCQEKIIESEQGQLYVKTEIETMVCVQVVRVIRCSCSFPLFLWWQVNWSLIICITKLKSIAADVPY